MQKRLMFFETAGSIIWFFMDAFWMKGWGTLAKAAILPSLIPNLLTFRYTERALAPMMVTAAMNSWLVMNILWMVGDLDKKPELVQRAEWFFITGVLSLVIACIKTVRERDSLLDIMSRFKRFRLRRVKGDI